MSGKISHRISVAMITLTFVGFAHAQHSFSRTKTVDPSGSADFTTIQAAINAFGAIGFRGTVLIHSGTYAENITLNEFDENIDLVGIDREGVIIAPSTGDGIVITSGTETSRKNLINNLTIVTTDGHGIKLVKGGTPDIAGIIIDAVTIDANGTGQEGINAEDANDIRILNCDISSDLDTGIELKNADDVFVQNTRITARDFEGFATHGVCNDITLMDCQVFGGETGVRLLKGDRLLLQNCDIVGDNSLAAAPVPHQVTGVFFDRLSGGGPAEPPADILAIGCRISAVATGQTSSSHFATAVRSDTDTFPRVVDCTLNASANAKSVYGVFAGGGSDLDPVVRVIGGEIITECDDEKETEVWDLRREDPTNGTGILKMSGTRCSKWRGPIQSAERQRDTTQRTINVAVASSTAILGATILNASEQSITAGITDPDVFRVTSVTGNQAGMTQDVYVIGTDWADNPITDKITLSGTSTVVGVKPFKTVTKIILPAQSAAFQTVSAGTTTKLGLAFPISAASDLLQQGRKASAATSYTLESSGTVDSTYATIDVSTITASDSFEWYALASQ